MLRIISDHSAICSEGISSDSLAQPLQRSNQTFMGRVPLQYRIGFSGWSHTSWRGPILSSQPMGRSTADTKTTTTTKGTRKRVSD